LRERIAERNDFITKQCTFAHGIVFLPFDKRHHIFTRRQLPVHRLFVDCVLL
jgi:hypothetical protein